MNLSIAMQQNTMIPHLIDGICDDESIAEWLGDVPNVESSEKEHLLRELTEMQEALDEIAQCVIY